MADWTQTTHGFQVQITTVPVSGTDATLSGITPFLRFTDTEAGHEDFRLYVDADVFQIDWLSGTGPDVWTNILKITDPTVAVPIFEFNKYTLKLANLAAAAGTKVIQLIVGVEANERWNIENSGEQNWGPGGATPTDTTLGRTAVGVLQTEMLRVLADPSVGNDVSRKTYVDAQVGLKVAKAGDVMTGLLTLSGNPSAALHAAPKQYVDALLPAGGAVAKSGDTMTGTLTFDVAANGTILQTKIASETNPRYRFDANGRIEWGPGGATAPDTILERVAAATLRLTSSLGIGASPAAGVSLDISSALSITKIRVTNTAADGDQLISFFMPTVQEWVVGIDDSDADKFKIAASGALETGTLLTITTAGFVGIGTDAPGTLLDVAGASGLVVRASSGSSRVIEVTVAGAIATIREAGGAAADELRLMQAASGILTLGTNNIVRVQISSTGIFTALSEVEIDGALNHDGTTVGFYGTAPVVQAAAAANLTDSSGGTANDTVQALTDPADAPGTADALRDDLVANLIPQLRNNYADLTAKMNKALTVLRDLGLMAP